MNLRKRHTRRNGPTIYLMYQNLTNVPGFPLMKGGMGGTPPFHDVFWTLLPPCPPWGLKKSYTFHKTLHKSAYKLSNLSTGDWERGKRGSVHISNLC